MEMSSYGKYELMDIDDFICNKDLITKIKTWICNYNKNKKNILQSKDKPKGKKRKSDPADIYSKSTLLITGDHGIGKSSTVNSVLRKYGYSVISFDFKNIPNSKNLEESIKKLVKSNNIMKVMNGPRQEKKVIFLDNIETITSPKEAKNILAFIKINEKFWFYPTILISKNSHNKLLSKLYPKILPSLEFKKPVYQEMKKILVYVCKKEKLKLQNIHVANLIIEKSQSDIRRLINTLLDLQKTYCGEPITKDLIDRYYAIFQSKDLDIDLYQATHALIAGYDGVDNCLRYYETEKVNLPLMVHQYYIYYVMSNFSNNQKKHDVSQIINESLSFGDVIENSIYGNQNWYMQEIHGYYSCVAPSFHLHNGALKKKSNIKYEFADDLNRTSIRQINKKNISKANQCFKGKNIEDFIYMNKIVKKLIDENRIDDCIQLLKGYNCKLEDVECLLKIDKIKSNKYTLSTKQKKEFQKYFA